MFSLSLESTGELPLKINASFLKFSFNTFFSQSRLQMQSSENNCFEMLVIWKLVEFTESAPYNDYTKTVSDHESVATIIWLD
jgi:hypothetical protein